jgi:hypothetical protein
MPASTEEPDGGAPRASEPASDGGEAMGVRRDFLAALTVVTLIVGLVVGKWLVQRFAPRPSEEQCSELLDRYLQHASRQHDPEVDDDDIDTARERSHGQPTRIADVGTCQRELTEAQVRCGLASPNVDDMERCMQ